MSISHAEVKHELSHQVTLPKCSSWLFPTHLFKSGRFTSKTAGFLLSVIVVVGAAYQSYETERNINEYGGGWYTYAEDPQPKKRRYLNRNTGI